MTSGDEIRRELETVLGEPIRNIRRVGGGCIAEAGCIETKNGWYFAKWGGPSVARTFEAEAEGLMALADAASGIRIPSVHAVRRLQGGRGVLLMEWIDEEPLRESAWKELGRGLAEIHAAAGSGFGFEHDNFIGATPQSNRKRDSWPQFFREERLVPQAALARSLGRWDSAWNESFDRLCRVLDELLPDRPWASLVHGDLWGGNVLSDRAGRPVLIDPAVYRGHSEVDIGMSRLFGSFPGAFYAAYDEARPPDPGRNEREPIYNLYHLINHLNLFGGSYAASVGSVLARF